jgi:hypothetical protein
MDQAGLVIEVSLLTVIIARRFWSLKMDTLAIHPIDPDGNAIVDIEPPEITASLSKFQKMRISPHQSSAQAGNANEASLRSRTPVSL